MEMKIYITFMTQAQKHGKTPIMFHWLYFGEMSVWMQGLPVWQLAEWETAAGCMDWQMGKWMDGQKGGTCKENNNEPVNE